MIRSKPAGLLFLTLSFGTLAGCGKSQPTEAAPTPGTPGTAKSDPTPKPVPQATPKPNPLPAADLYTLDTTKHNIPPAPVSGRLKGKAFTPDRVELEGNKLSLRAGGDFFPDQEISLTLKGDSVPAEGLKLVVKSSQKWTDDQSPPMMQVAFKKPNSNLPETQFVNDGYALTLELGKPEKGKVPGKIFISLADPEKSYLAGTFTAQRKRGLSDAPGDESVPFIQGSVSPPLKEDQSVKVGYAGFVGGQVVSDMSGMRVPDDGRGSVRSTTFAPREATLRFEKFTPKFDFTNLPPGRYLLYVAVEDGPAAWEWVDVKDGARVTKDLKFDEGNLGTVEVKLAETRQKVRLVPTDFGSPPPPDALLSQLAFSLERRAEVKDGVATFARVPEGKYRVEEGGRRVEVEVIRGKTATVELKGVKK